MQAERLPKSLAALDMRFDEAGAAARIHVRPIAIVSGRPAAALLADGRGRRIAGAPLAATFCEVSLRVGKDVDRFLLEAATLAAWAGRRESSAARRAAALLDRIEAPRPGLTGMPSLMGVVNVTPDSFSDGGETLTSAAALRRCRALADAGATILDIGGESTRPGATPVSPAAEWGRVQPVLEGLRRMRGELRGVSVSIDTRHAEVMQAALATGVDIINDVIGLSGDGDSLSVAVASTARIVLMHMQGTPEAMNVAPRYDDVALDVFDFLESRIDACISAGIERERLIVDPGIGFGKRGRENQAILRALPLFHGLGCPILLGLSRKGLGVSEESVPPQSREPTSHAAAMFALSAGVQMLRVHDVAGARQVVALWRRLADPGT